MLSALEFACNLASALEEGAISDGTHLGVTDSEFVARILRNLVTLVEDGVISHEILSR
jgi:hypothetical protein